jgi:hypothetical protein
MVGEFLCQLLQTGRGSRGQHGGPPRPIFPVFYTQHYWVSGLCPSTVILYNYNTLVQRLMLAPSKGPNRVGVLFTWGRKQTQFPKRCIYSMDKAQSVTHRRQNPADSVPSRYCQIWRPPGSLCEGCCLLRCDVLIAFYRNSRRHILDNCNLRSRPLCFWSLSIVRNSK